MAALRWRRAAPCAPRAWSMDRGEPWRALRVGVPIHCIDLVCESHRLTCKAQKMCAKQVKAPLRGRLVLEHITSNSCKLNHGHMQGQY